MKIHINAALDITISYVHMYSNRNLRMDSNGALQQEHNVYAYVFYKVLYGYMVTVSEL